MHRPSIAKTATLNSASIMAPSTESKLPFEGLICHAPWVFPVASNASDNHHSLVLLIGGPQWQRPSAPEFQRMSALPPIADIGTQCRNVRFGPLADMGMDNNCRVCHLAFTFNRRCGCRSVRSRSRSQSAFSGGTRSGQKPRSAASWPSLRKFDLRRPLLPPERTMLLYGSGRIAGEIAYSSIPTAAIAMM